MSAFPSTLAAIRPKADVSLGRDTPFQPFCAADR
jgi:hypothetical protein